MCEYVCLVDGCVGICWLRDYCFIFIVEIYRMLSGCCDSCLCLD